MDRPRPETDRSGTDPTRPTPPLTPALPPEDALAPVAASPEALVLPGGWQIDGLPATIRRAGPQAAERTVEFFTAAQAHRLIETYGYSGGVAPQGSWTVV